jgi:endonuclease-3
LTNQVSEIIQRLKEEYPDVRCELDYQTPLQLLVATVLSAQTTDKQVNKVTAKMFADCPDLDAFLKLTKEEIKGYIHTLGFYNAKADHLYLLFRQLASDFNGEVPRTMEELTKLSGVGRKTANLLLGDLYAVPGSVVCDTHCIRICGRLGLTDGTKDPEKAERQLRAILPPEESSDFCHRIVLFGREVCTARNPQCGDCPLTALCKHMGGV